MVVSKSFLSQQSYSKYRGILGWQDKRTGHSLHYSYLCRLELASVRSANENEQFLLVHYPVTMVIGR